MQKGGKQWRGLKVWLTQHLSFICCIHSRINPSGLMDVIWVCSRLVGDVILTPLLLACLLREATENHLPPSHPIPSILLCHIYLLHVFFHYIHEFSLHSVFFFYSLAAPSSTSSIQLIYYPSSTHVQTLTALPLWLTSPVSLLITTATSKGLRADPWCNSTPTFPLPICYLYTPHHCLAALIHVLYHPQLLLCHSSLPHREPRFLSWHPIICFL